MADITVTATSVVPSATAIIVHGTAGEAVTAGQALYYDTTTSTYKKADADALASARIAGIALCNAATGQPVTLVVDGVVTIGATVVKGTPYFVSTTAGGICLHSDLGAGDYVSLVGIADSTSTLSVKCFALGAVI